MNQSPVLHTSSHGAQIGRQQYGRQRNYLDRKDLAPSIPFQQYIPGNKPQTSIFQ